MIALLKCYSITTSQLKTRYFFCSHGASKSCRGGGAHASASRDLPVLYCSNLSMFISHADKHVDFIKTNILLNYRSFSYFK